MVVAASPPSGTLIAAEGEKECNTWTRLSLQRRLVKLVIGDVSKRLANIQYVSSASNISYFSLCPCYRQYCTCISQVSHAACNAVACSQSLSSRSTNASDSNQPNAQGWYASIRRATLHRKRQATEISYASACHGTDHPARRGPAHFSPLLSLPFSTNAPTASANLSFELLSSAAYQALKSIR